MWIADLGLEFKSFEEDFANGYLIGMVLFRYGLQPDFGQFSNKVSYSLSNLSKIQLALERLSIKFDPHRLVNKDPGYSLSLLDKIYKALHNIPVSGPSYKKSSLSQPPPSLKERLNEKQKRFDDFHQAQLKRILQDEENQKEVIFKTRLKERQSRIDVLRTNKTFMQTWQGEGIENWKKNVQRKKERILHEKTVKLKLSNDKKRRVVLNNEFYLQDTADGIKEFEKNMIRLGIDYNAEPEKKVVRQDLAVEAAATIAKIKENKEKAVEAAKEREVRQRNLFIEQKKNEKFEVHKKATNRILALIKNALDDSYRFVWVKVSNYAKRVRKVQEVEKNISHYRTLSEEKWGSIDRKRIEMMEAQELAARKELSEKKKNFRKVILENKLKSQEIHFQMIRPVLIDLVLLSEEVFDVLSKGTKIPSGLWNGWMEVFKNKVQSSVVELVQEPQKNPLETKQIFDEVCNEYARSYIAGSQEWGPLPNNYLLADCIEQIIDSSFPLSPSPAMPEGPSYLPFKLLILGPHFSGKKFQSKKLCDTFSLKSFELPKILEEAKKVVQRKSEPEDTKGKKKVVEEEPEIFVQASLESNAEDELGRAKLFRARIRGVFGDSMKLEDDPKKVGKKEEAKSQGFILIGYPSTLQEAVDLERQLSGFVHPSELPPETRDLKKAEAQELIKYRPKDLVPVKFFNGYWDLVIALDVDEENAVKRATERRVDPAGNLYNLLVNPPPDNILAKCKSVDWPGEEWLRNEFVSFNANKEQLLHWFSLFGGKTQGNLLRVEANLHPDLVFEQIKARCLDALAGKSRDVVEDEVGEKGIERDKAVLLFEVWEKMVAGYKEQVLSAFAMFRGVSCEIEESLVALQEEFLKVLKENDNKPSIAHDFTLELNDLLRSKSIFSKAEADDIQEKIENISDSLWDLVSQRKEKLVTLKDSFISSYNVNHQLSKIANLSILLTKCEAFKYSHSCTLIQSLSSSSYPSPSISIPSEVTHPLQDFLYFFKSKCLNSLISYPELQEENNLFEFRLNSILRWVSTNIKTFNDKIDKVFKRFDDWIKQAVILENKSINNYIHAVRESFRSKDQLSYQFPSDLQILSSLSI